MRAAAFIALVTLSAPLLADEPAATEAADGGEAAVADPSAPTVGASVDRSEAHVGDRLTLTVTVVAAAAVAASVTLPSPALGGFEVLDSSRTDRDLGDGRASRRFVLQIAAYQLGELEIPALAVEYTSAQGERRSVKTAAIPVSLRKVVDDPAGEMQPLAHTREVMIEDQRPRQALLAAAAALALVGAALVTRTLLRRRRLRPVAAAPAVVRSPEDVALERLAELRRRGAFEVDGYRPFHFELAEVVRAYLGQRYRFDALELTTTELLAELERGPLARQQRLAMAPPPAVVGSGEGSAEAEAPAPAPAPAPLGPAASDAGPPTGPRTLTPPPMFADDLARVRDFLDRCDLVKFAKAPSSDGAALELLDNAEALVRSTTAIAAASTLGPASQRVSHG